MVSNKNIWVIIGAFLAIYIIWGSTYLFNKIALSEIPPYKMSGTRFLCAGILIFIIAGLTTKNWNLSSKKVKNALIAGMLFLTLGNGGVAWALQYVDSGFAALVISSQPLVLLIMMWIIDKTPIRPMSWGGVFLGMTGIYLLVSQNELVSTDKQWLGVFVIFTCLISWGYASIFVSKAELPRNHFLNSGIQMLSAGISMLTISYFIGEPMFDIYHLSSKVWGAMIFLILFGSIIAFTAFNFLLKHVSPEKVSTSTYVNPVVAMILGWAVLNEPITLQSIIAASILLLGVYFINSTRKFPTKKSN